MPFFDGASYHSLLGYGGTDKPETAESYRMGLMAQDIIDVLDHENLKNLIAVAHDWYV